MQNELFTNMLTCARPVGCADWISRIQRYALNTMTPDQETELRHKGFVMCTVTVGPCTDGFYYKCTVPIVLTDSGVPPTFIYERYSVIG
jgi:hypothetical protein